MSNSPILSRVARAERHKRIVATYRAGLSSREVARRFGMNDSHVRWIIRLYDAARPVGRPAS